MRWYLLAGLLLLLFVLAACKNQQYLVCPDGVTQVLDLSRCPPSSQSCPLSCDDNESCTSDFCNPSTNWQCAHRDLVPCDGNGECEQGEFPWSPDCPSSCDDRDACTTDAYRYETQQCVHEELLPCCGNAKCDSGETFVSCQADCRQTLDIEVTKFEKRQRIEGGSVDLTRTEFTYLFVKFTIHNLDIDRQETLDFKTQKGYLFDPYKMKLEDDKGSLYSVEYDSELMEGWLDTAILPKGNTVTALVGFTVPLNFAGGRLVIYDKFGARLDSSVVY